MFVSKEKPFYNVTQVSELLGISADRLRSYDEEKIVAPARIGTGAKRLYSELDVEWLKDVRSVISKNRMNIYSLKLMLKIIDLIPQKDFDKLVEAKNDDDTLVILKRMMKNPNFKKLKSLQE